MSIAAPVFSKHNVQGDGGEIKKEQHTQFCFKGTSRSETN